MPELLAQAHIGIRKKGQIRTVRNADDGEQGRTSRVAAPQIMVIQNWDEELRKSVLLNNRSFPALTVSGGLPHAKAVTIAGYAETIFTGPTSGFSGDGGAAPARLSSLVNGMTVTQAHPSDRNAAPAKPTKRSIIIKPFPERIADVTVGATSTGNGTPLSSHGPGAQ